MLRRKNDMIFFADKDLLPLNFEMRAKLLTPSQKRFPFLHQLSDSAKV